MSFVHAIWATALSISLSGADWPTYQHDNARSGVTVEQLPAALSEQWRYQAALPPRPAWPAPANRDIWNEVRELKPLVTYDRAFHTVAAGDLVFFGSSADDTVRALDASTGEERWVFFTEGPVRLAPAVDNGRLYAGSDDGSVYSLEATTGKLLWRRQPDASSRRLPGNGRIISSRPVRAGLLVEGGRVYYCAGLFPEEGVLACALQAETGQPVWEKPLTDLSPQGYVLASAKRLFVPTGRTAPAIFNKATGELEASLDGPGGAYALVVDDFLYNLTGRSTQVGLVDAATRERIASFDGLHVIAKQSTAFLHTQKELSSFDRIRHTELSRQSAELDKRVQELRTKQKKTATASVASEIKTLQGEIRKLDQSKEECFAWRVPCTNSYSLIMAGNTLYTGGDSQVVAYDATTGQRIWAATVDGSAYGLSVANGRLLVSTDRGTVHCFASAATSTASMVKSSAVENPYPSDGLSPVYEAAANQILKQTEIRQGLCLVVGAEQGRLALELARRSQLTIVAVEPSLEKVRVARQALAKAGLYGSRVVVHQSENLESLNYGTYLFNLIVSDQMLLNRALPHSPSEIQRLLRPQGGVACLGYPVGKPVTDQNRQELQRWLPAHPEYHSKIVDSEGLWLAVRRDPVPRSGEWTQLYANSSHTACSEDDLRGPMAIQWFGEPGPRQIVDRHHRPMSSLVKDGRVFVPGNDTVFAVDAYNGSSLWQLDVPDMRRVGALKDSGQMLVTSDSLYLVRKAECWRVQVDNGRRIATLKTPSLGQKEPPDWGYLNQVDDRLYGTAQASGAGFNLLHKDMVNTLEGDFRPVIVSQALFCLDRHSGQQHWIYQKGAIMNSAIAIGENRILFVESRNPNAISNRTGRLGIREFCASDNYLVALNRISGKVLYERPVKFPFEHILFLNYAENTILITGTYNEKDRVYYGLRAFHGDTGHAKWQTSYLALDVRGNEPAGTEGSHGEQWQHPVIVGNRVYSRPYDFDLHTGAKGSKTIYRGGHGCGGWTGSLHYLYGRGSNPRMYDLAPQSTQGDRLTSVSRPGCWLNIIPAGGLVLIPESSSGCSCAYSIQTSLAMVPRSVCRP